MVTVTCFTSSVLTSNNNLQNDFIVFALQANWWFLWGNAKRIISDHTYLFQVPAKHSGGRLTVRHLNWSLDFKAEEFASPESYDIVVASDVVYDMQVTFIFPHISATFSYFSRLNVLPVPNRLLVVYQRHIFYTSLWHQTLFVKTFIRLMRGPI